MRNCKHQQTVQKTDIESTVETVVFVHMCVVLVAPKYLVAAVNLNGLVI